MMVELYNATKPASTLRAWVSSIFLLALACVLAAALCWNRARDPLSVRLEPDGWPISFRPPKQFARGEVIQTPFGPLIPFFRTTTGSFKAKLAIIYLYPSYCDDPSFICTDIARLWAFGDSPGEPPAPVKASWGPFEGVETDAKVLSTVARVAVSSTRVGYAVALSVERAPVDKELRRLFDLTCRSIQLAGR